ncbi:MAG: DUF2207 domain-containing protein [Candidatus Nanopelagicales bacterium]
MVLRVAAIWRVVLILLAAIGLLWPLFVSLYPTDGDGAEDPVTISEYRASMDVGGEGQLSAVEDIQAVFPAGRHGIFRYWDVVDTADPGVRYIPSVSSITMDGHIVPYDLSWTSNDRFLVAKVGDPDRYVSPGTHRYRIKYTIPGAISPASAGATARFGSTAQAGTGEPGSAFLWSVVARGWEMRIVRAVVTIGLPAPAIRVQCSAGSATAATPCTIEGAGTDEVTVSAANLAPRTGMTVRATMAPAAPGRATLPWSVTWDPILGRSVVGLLVVLVGAGIALVGGVAWGRMAREEPPGFPVQYAPPDGLGPVQVVFMHTEDVGPDALAATLMHMAERGVVQLDRSPDSPDRWTITGIGRTEWEATDPVAQAVAAELGVRLGGTFTADPSSVEAGKVLASARNRIGPAVRHWAVSAGLVHSAPNERVGQVAWGLSAAFAILGFTGLAWPTAWGLPFATFVIAAASLIAAGVGRRRTTTGRLVWSRAGGFERLLSTPSAEDRFDFSARKDLFIAFIPYAVAFGVADRWAQKYRTAVGSEPPVPAWYPYYPGYAMGGFYSGGGLDSFSTALSDSISAYTASQSSSSGGGGGGFGGGGGGGGGSW